MIRYNVNEDEETLEALNEALEEAGVDYDFDSGDRYMIDDDYAQEFENVCDELGVDYDEI